MKNNTSHKQPEASSLPFRIGYPLLWLAAAVCLVYASCLNFGFTELDDSIFIRELYAYNEDISNLLTSFRRGVFDPVNDTYYRPFFLDSMILNYQMSGQEIIGYHFVNLLLHLGSVILLFFFLQALTIDRTKAFLLSLIFAIHPVLSQAVAWIPGRNDTLMVVFVLSFLLLSIRFTKEGKWPHLVFATLLLVCAFFTKESALFAPIAAVILLTLVLQRRLFDKRLLLQYLAWAVAGLIYFGIRSQATLKSSFSGSSQVLQDFMGRLPVLLQYLGKIFFPFNLSVFPVKQDTVYYWGIAAILFLVIIILLAKERRNRVIIAGGLFFFIFLLPVLLVPNTLNEQAFEHRLYLPIIGILLLLPETVLFRNSLTERTVLYITLGIAAVFAFINYNHQQNFKDPLTFWRQAAETSPHSAYAVMMYGARVEDKQQGYALMREAYALNPKEKYLNYYYGVMLQNQDSVLQSEKHFLTEQKISDYYECDFYLAKVDYERKDFNKAIAHLERYITRDSMNGPANNNLLLLYKDTRQKQKALNHISGMQRRGMTVPAEVIREVEFINP